MLEAECLACRFGAVHLDGGTLKGTLDRGVFPKSLTIFNGNSLLDSMGTLAISKHPLVDLVDSIEDEQLAAFLTRSAKEKTIPSASRGRIEQLPPEAKEEFEQSYTESFDLQPLISRQDFETHLGTWDEKSS
ncbi:MAG: hypothetical protein AAFQ98_03925 [Bacteroidota bacterium]